MSRLAVYGIALAAVLALGFGAGWSINGWRAGAREKAAVEAAREAERKATQTVIDTLKTDIRTSQEASNAYQAELARLRDNPPALPPVRLCKPASRPPADLPTSSTTPRGSDDPAEAGTVVSPDPGADPDISPQLAELADAGDRCSAQLRALIDWVNRTR